MNLSDMPPLVAIPFGNSAGSSYIRAVPVPSQIGVTAGAASFTDGFTPDTFEPLDGGGAYVSGRDVNGIMNHVTKWTRWQSAGGPAVYNAALATGMSGYPKGAQVVSTQYDGLVWFNTVDGNMTDPDGGSPAGWIVSGSAAATLAQAEAATLGNVYLSPLVLAQLLSSIDAQSIRLANGRIFKMGALALNHPNTNTSTTPLVFATPFPNAFAGIVCTGNLGSNPDWGALTLTGQGMTRTGGTIAADSGNASYGINNAITCYWIAWGT